MQLPIWRNGFVISQPKLGFNALDDSYKHKKRISSKSRNVFLQLSLSY